MKAEDHKQEEHDVILLSKVRYFPLPTAEWYEICEGWLNLTEDEIDFEPQFTIGQPERGASSRHHSVKLNDITLVRRDRWLSIPCLRIEAGGDAYRYGWTSQRKKVHEVFNVEEWIKVLKFYLDIECFSVEPG
jgi:hypothetical protein